MDIKRRVGFDRADLSRTLEEYQAVLFLLGSLDAETLVAT